MINLRDDFIFDKLTFKNFVTLSDDEIEFVRNCRNHDEIRKWMNSDYIIPLQEHIDFISNLKQDNKNYYWLVNMEEVNIGVISLNRIDLNNKNAYCGMYLNQFQILEEGAKLIFDDFKKLVFDYANFHTLKIEIIDTNIRAVKFAKKMGFIEEGRLKEFVLRNGKWHDMIILGITITRGE
jgi:UDP-4-amino-4,6-dideoxy-N-acetyl-beta-L-altrosamine N-acetyltransferase